MSTAMSLDDNFLMDFSDGLLLEYDLQFFADDDAGDKTEEPSQRKLDNARDEGQVAKSKELGNAFGLVTLFVCLNLFMESFGESFLGMFDTMYNRIPDVISQSKGGFSQVTNAYFFTYTLERIILMVLPLFIISCIVAFIVSLVQVKWKISTKPLQPKFSKFNPVSGFKRIFSKDALFELLKSILKILVIVIVAYVYLKDNMDFIFVLYEIPLFQAIGLFGSLAINLGLYISIVFMIVGIVDLIYEKRKFHKNMMMTKQEVKDEYKNIEGNPEAKNKQKQIMRQASQRRMMQAVPEADVIITNPTHLAVALQYRQGEMMAPVVIAKGEDYLARKIKEVAADNDIEIVEDKPLARMLYLNVEVGEMIPPELYQAVADVLAYVYKLKHAS